MKSHLKLGSTHIYRQKHKGKCNWLAQGFYQCNRHIKGRLESTAFVHIHYTYSICMGVVRAMDSRKVAEADASPALPAYATDADAVLKDGTGAWRTGKVWSKESCTDYTGFHCRM